MIGSDAGQILLADVQVGQQGQGHRIPLGMANDPGGGDPDVAVEELVSSRTWGGVVVDAGPLDAGSVALGGRVVQGQQPVWAGVDLAAQVGEQQSGAEGNLAAPERAQQG